MPYSKRKTSAPVEGLRPSSEGTGAVQRLRVIPYSLTRFLIGLEAVAGVR